MQGNHPALKRAGTETVRGRVVNYTNTDRSGGAYRRPVLQRLLEAALYGQRVEDHLHMFSIRTGNLDPLAGGHVDIPVNVHGTISGGAALADNMTVEVTGRMKGGVLMAERVDVVSASCKTQVLFQHDLGEELSVFGPAALVSVVLLGALLGGGLGLFVATWLFTSAVIGVAWTFLLSRLGVVAFLLLRGGRDGGSGVPVMAILTIGLLITIVFW